MPRLERFAPALIGLALAAPATAQSQSHAHTSQDCAYCNPDSRSTPIVEERRGPLARMMGGDRVIVPAGHHVQHPGRPTPGPVAAYTDNPGALPPASPWYGSHDAEAGVAVVGPGYAPAPGYAPVPGMAYGPIAAEGEPMPIGEMRTSFVTPPGSPAGMAGPAMHGAAPAPTGWQPDPAIQAWHQYKLGESEVPSRPGALSKMLGVASVTNWLEERRTMKAMRRASRAGMYSPTMNQMPSRAIPGH
ncbi:hypothetical protein [Tautonia plasticadhaerens]|uniref:Uncharacterized protein n=1 Tax=Tautonia plasticadhaerens TaxID=2527974 RepID=A0A518GW68_9BACT|nr:hypothetical protein [Tautonia plasticadhaerens]QDV32828.1 hypothetical protein ElP_06680 [Tautonia plasticadhaerens]